MFIGSSPIRQYTEGWSIEWLLKTTEDAIKFAVKEGLQVMYVTEDTTRSDPATLRRLYECAIRAGAHRICLADTVGHATPWGAAAVVRFAMQVIRDAGAGIELDWHGHRDRDLAIINSIAAIEAGATRVHAAALGVGERVGNTPMDLLLVNLVVMGFIDRDLAPLMDYVETVSAATDVPIPDNYPVVGRDAFRTATGVHAAAVVKAWKKGDRDLMDAVYSAIPGLASSPSPGNRSRTDVREVERRVLAGEHGIPCSDPVVDRVFAKAKSRRRLTEAEILAEVYR
jgi:2-isopropylmalate synthase